MKKRILSLLLVIAMLLPVFNMTVIAANEPTITSHKNGKTYAADDFYIKWNSVSGAKRYRLAVKSLNDGSYAADIWWDDKLTKTKYECDEDDIKPGHRYKIWVGACGSSHDDVISQYSIEVTAKAAVCDHDDYEDYYDYTKYEQISGDNTYHNAVHYYERVCDDCDETIKSNVKGNIEKEKHNFSGDKCKSCGYKKTCSHDDYEDYYDYTKYEQISGDNNYHNAVNYYERECEDCGKTIKTDVKGNTEKEKHSFSGDTCTVCKYKKAVHKHTTQDYYKTTKYEQISGDDTYHRAVHYYDTKCTDCGTTTETNVKGDTEKEKHSFSGDTCSVCKYKKSHKHTTQDYYKTTKYEQISGDDTYHRAVHYYDTKCTDCGTTTETNVKGDTEKEKHSFSGDTCTVCKYKKSHKHTTQDYYKTTKYEQISGDDTYHRAVHYHDTKCTDCGTTTKTDVKGNTEKEKHSFSGDICTVCKYKKSHKHTTQDYYKTTKYEQISGDDTYHRAVHYYDTKCTDCGETVKTDVKGTTQKEKHSFSGNQCTKCDYAKKTEDNTKPQIGEIKSSATNTFVKGTSTTINITVSDDNLSVVKLYVDGKETKSFSTSNISYKLNGLSVGTHQIKIVATDKYKNSAEKSITITVTDKIEQEKEDKKNQTFTDVSKDEYYADDVEELNNKGIITGYGNGEFKPNNTLTRAEAAVILCRLNGNFNLSPSKTKFTDVNSTYEWASGYIAKAVQLGIISGMPDGTYKPEGTLTAEQFITMIIRWLGLDNNATNRSGENWADGYIAVAKEIGLLDDVSMKNYSKNISRADASVISNTARGLKGNVKKEELNTNITKGKVYTSKDNAKRTGGDKDGLSCALYAPTGNLTGISTHLNLSDIETVLYTSPNPKQEKDVDNAYAYLCMNSNGWNGDYGIIKRLNNNDWEICTSEKDPTDSNWRWMREDNKNTITIDTDYVYRANNGFDNSQGIFIKNSDKIQDLQMDLHYSNGILTYSLRIRNTSGNSVLIYKNEIKCGNLSDIVFGRVASITNSQGIDYGNENYLKLISSTQKNINRQPVEFKNIKFFDSYYYTTSSYKPLTVSNGELWIYPNKNYNNTNTSNGIVTTKDGTPIVQCDEYEENGIIFDRIDFENY